MKPCINVKDLHFPGINTKDDHATDAKDGRKADYLNNKKIRPLMSKRRRIAE